MDFSLIAACIFFIAIIIGWIFAILRGIAHFVAFIMCIGKRNCKKDDCCFRRFCNRTVLSDKEKEVFRKKLESMDDAEDDRK